MLVRFFRRSYLVHYVVLIILSVVLFLPAILGNHPQMAIRDEFIAPGWELIMYLTGGNSMILVILQVVVTFVSAVLLNITLDKYDLTSKNTLIPAFIMILFSSHYSGFFEPNPIIFSSIFLIVALYLLFAIYLEVDAFDKVFYSGFLVACASLFYFPSVFFIVFVFFTFIIYRLYKWRDWIIATMGLLTPYLFYFTYLFWFDRLLNTLIIYRQFFSDLFIFKAPIRFNILEYVILAGLLVCFLLGVFKLITTVNDNLITVRKRYWSVFWFIVLSLFIFMVSWFEGVYNPVYLIIGLSIVVTYYISSLKRYFWQDFILSLLMLLILANNFYILFLEKI